MAKPDQGKVYEVTSKCSVSNHFIRSGAFTRFCDWRFVFKARLDIVALNGARRWGADKDKRCRVCSYENETLPHVLNSCWKHSDAIQRRHNAIIDRLETAIIKMRGFTGVVRKDKAVPDCDFSSTLRPDIVWIDEAKKTMKIVDVAVTFENRYLSLEKIRATKIEKYAPIADEFRRKGWIVDLDAIVVGSLGGWDPANEATLRMLRISRWYLRLMRKLIVSDTIRWSRDIYVEHITGKRMYRTTREGGDRVAAAATTQESSRQPLPTEENGINTEGDAPEDFALLPNTAAPLREDIDNINNNSLTNPTLTSLDNRTTEEVGRPVEGDALTHPNPQEQQSAAPPREDYINIINSGIDNLAISLIDMIAETPDLEPSHQLEDTPQQPWNRRITPSRTFRDKRTRKSRPHRSINNSSLSLLRRL